MKIKLDEHPGSRAFVSLAMLACAVAVYFALDYFFDLPPMGLQFVSETITATPAGDAVTFDCRFHFRAHHPRRRSYEIGFPVVEQGPAPDFEVTEVSADGKPIAFRKLAEGIAFDLPAPPGGEVDSVIRYRLAAPERRAVYVTRSANLWPQPPQVARFVVAQNATSNYHKSGAGVADFHNFRPDDNWHISWGGVP